MRIAVERSLRLGMERLSPRVRWIPLAVLLLIAWPVEGSLAQPLAMPGQDPVAGSRVFEMKGCVKCHAIHGVGGTIGPDLGRLPRSRSFYDFAAAMWNHLPKMGEATRQWDLPRPYLSPQESGDLIAFLSSLNYIGAPAEPGDPTRGRPLVRDKGCLRCHSISGEGGTGGGDLTVTEGPNTPSGVIARLWNHAFAMAPRAQIHHIEWPRFTAEDMADLVAFLQALGQAGSQGK